ncbi:MFS transporter [Bacteroidales bacterium OttesenSCG-928-M06]|nr:MFS transporter [Bacteroidales bacterium OttesenSCG-928-M06]
MKNNSKKRNPWAWIPSLYFAEGLPNIAVTFIAVVMYKNLGMSNTDIALYTSWFYLPWVIKPFWSPFVDILKTKRWWILSMQLLIGAGFAGIAFSIPTHFHIQLTLAFFWLIAFSSATHDIASDGFYLLGLEPNEQAFFVGIRSTFYRFSTIFGQGILVLLAGILEKKTGDIPFAWSLTFFIIAGLFLALFAYHKFILPYPKTDKLNPQKTASDILKEFAQTFVSFFKKEGALAAIFFMLTYRFSEVQLLKLVQPFMLDPIDKGGLGLDTSQVGVVYGIIGTIGLLLGGILGGFVASRGGLKKWLWPMMLSMLLTSIVFVYLAYFPESNLFIINFCVFLEQFGYGFGFTAYMLFLMYYSKGKHRTAHYAICTGFMALGKMFPGMFSGWIQEQIGYQHFFIYVMICSIVPIIAASLLKIDPEYGKATR